MRHLAAAALLVACGAPEIRTVLLEPQCCACPPDAAVPDAPPDAPAGIDLAGPWTRTTITAGSASAPFRGADGVAEDAEGCWWSAWEQGAAVSRACPAGAGWVTEIVAHASELAGAEDVKPGDLDGDGLVDGAIAVSGTSNAAVRIAFRGSTGVVALPASAGLGPVMQIAVADVDQDGDLDIVFGTQKTSSAAGTISWLDNPGSALARLGIHWTRHPISAAGWPMTVIALDMDGDGDTDVVVSDRAKLGTNDWSLYGARWHEQTAIGWTLHTVTGGAPTVPATPYQTGSCSPYTSQTCERTPGDEMMVDLIPVASSAGNDWLLVEGQSNGAQADSRVLLHLLGAGTHTVIPPVVDVGHYQHAIAMDVDEDGDLDIVASTWIADSLATADRTKSWLYWLRNNGDVAWSRGEISGAGAGVKGDNVARLGRCVVTSEQVDQLGVVAYCPPGVSLP